MMYWAYITSAKKIVAIEEGKMDEDKKRDLICKEDVVEYIKSFEAFNDHHAKRVAGKEFRKKI